jgi:hypothetical protein
LKKKKRMKSGKDLYRILDHAQEVEQPEVEELSTESPQKEEVQDEVTAVDTTDKEFEGDKFLGREECIKHGLCHLWNH